MRRISFNSESGVILPIVIILMLALTITGLAFLNAGVMENRLVRREVHKNQAFYLAEAGLERTLWNLKQDFENGSGDWTDDNVINGVSVGDPDDDDWRPFEYDHTSLGAGSYVVKLKYVDEDEIWVKSTGTEDVKNISKTVQVYVKIENISVWNNAIFAGTGAVAGQVIEGNALIHGSVLILGSGLQPDDLAIDMSGTAGTRNNYEGLPAELAGKIPPCPQTSFNGETVDSLDATLRVKQGKVGLSGTAKVGEQDWVGNSFKETMDGVYVTDGYGGNKGADNVYSDNGTGNPYDLGDNVQFPSLRDSYVDPDTGTSYSTYLNYLDANSLHISENEISSEVDDFNYFDANGSISWDQSEGKLTVNGIVYVDADSLDIGKKQETIEYSGTGTIVVAQDSGDGIVGNIRIHGDLLAQGTYTLGGGGFPNNALGLVTGTLDLATGAGESQLTMTGAFFAENEVFSAKQNRIAGTFVCNHFDITQVPSIYQVPDLATNLPPGIPGGPPDWHITVSQWSEVTS